MNIKKVDAENEYVTKSDLKELYDKIVEFMLKRFEYVYDRFDKVESRLSSIESKLGIAESTMATKQDIMLLHEKFVPYHKFDQLSLRVHTIEEKNKNA